jgi:hypothetical protein
MAEILVLILILALILALIPIHASYIIDDSSPAQRSSGIGRMGISSSSSSSCCSAALGLS